MNVRTRTDHYLEMGFALERAIALAVEDAEHQDHDHAGADDPYDGRCGA